MTNDRLTARRQAMLEDKYTALDTAEDVLDVYAEDNGLPEWLDGPDRQSFDICLEFIDSLGDLDKFKEFIRRIEQEEDA